LFAKVNIKKEIEYQPNRNGTLIDLDEEADTDLALANKVFSKNFCQQKKNFFVI
jgi:hypothetical protein